MNLATIILSALCALVLALVLVFRRKPEREECWNDSSTVGYHPTGAVPLAAEVTISTRYLLVQKGTAADGFIVNVANTRPWGVVTDEPTSGATSNVAMLGSTPGTLPMRGAGAIAAGSKLWTAAAGQVTDTYASGAYFVGRAVTACSGAGAKVEVQHCFPMLDASGTTL